MEIGLLINYAGGFKELAAEVSDMEAAGLDLAVVAEAYSYDAVSQLGYLAAKTERLKLMSGILQLYTRTPTLTAMTAAGLDYVSDGRYILGLGASGPQVIEGFHGVKYDAPLGRTREVVEICRKVWKRERLEYEGKYYTLPLPADQGTGLGKPLKIINQPVRDNIPIVLAAVGHKNVELTAEIADGWQPIHFYPEKAKAVWGESLEAGLAKRDPALGPLQILTSAALAIGDETEHLREGLKHYLALYVGGMGARGKNFYNTMACRYGYEDEAKLIQDLYLDGKKLEAAAAVPDELARDTNLVGPEGFIRERIAAYREAGVTTILVTPIGATKEERVAHIAKLRAIVDE
ncbi:MAG: LLM class F420-dependent oxidoreductase [Nocardiaceae bacterium]|nr:LLM class F420-dependent oxidoreductase [Nocardiaceae bacterium]